MTAGSTTTYVSVVVLVLAVGALAAWIPVRRFQRESLSELLKAE